LKRSGEPLPAVLTLLEQTIGPDHPTLATTLNNLAVVYEAQEKYGRLYRSTSVPGAA
jgi:hypothetical protein